MAKQISFNVTTKETETIHKIATKAVKEAHSRGVTLDILDVSMDITAVHANGNPLRLDDLLKADDFNFSHDVFGIQRHINRNSGKLENCFVPRYSTRQ